MTGDTPRPNPCPSCPYREDCPSGVWSAEEYDKLIEYDGEIHEQAMAGGIKRFGCHQADGHLCSGWVGHREHPSDLLAIRMGLLNGGVDPATLDYTTDVPLFRSGAEAAAHGKRDLAAPSEQAQATVRKVVTVRALRGDPVRFGDDLTREISDRNGPTHLEFPRSPILADKIRTDRHPAKTPGEDPN
jgi:hypothetical protein